MNRAKNVRDAYFLLLYWGDSEGEMIGEPVNGRICGSQRAHH